MHRMPSVIECLLLYVIFRNRDVQLVGFFAERVRQYKASHVSSPPSGMPYLYRSLSAKEPYGFIDSKYTGYCTVHVGATRKQL